MNQTPKDTIPHGSNTTNSNASFITRSIIVLINNQTLHQLMGVLGIFMGCFSISISLIGIHLRHELTKQLIVDIALTGVFLVISIALYGQYIHSLYVPISWVVLVVLLFYSNNRTMTLINGIREARKNK